MEEEQFKVLTLNCWGVFKPLPTVRKDDRLKYLAKSLANGVFDIIMLQEVWTDDDYAMLRKALCSQYEYSVYFHSNYIGMGLCIFSKWPIDSTLVHPYSANGYPHLLHQGDWYCGKGIGLARVTSRNGFRINLYNTHLIARYEVDRKQDLFEAHRISQLLELLQFIRMTADSADAFIATGDYNLESDTSAIQLFRTFLGASDAWLHNATVSQAGTSLDKLEFDGCTCDRADNPYGNKVWTKFYGNGERLDYIFYRAGVSPLDPITHPNVVRLECNSSWLDFREVAEDPNGLHYSDHEGVAAQFTISRLQAPDSLGYQEIPDPSKLESMLLEMNEQINRGLFQCRQGRLRHLTYSLLISLLLILFLLNTSVYHWAVTCLILVITGVLSVALFALFWGSVVGRTAERRALENSKSYLKFLLRSIRSNESRAQSKQQLADDDVIVTNGFGDDVQLDQRHRVP